MKKRFLTLGLLALFFVSVMAERIPERVAQGIVTQFIGQNSGMRKAQAAGKTVRLAASSAGYYVYNIGAGSGFVVVAADDLADQTVLGYADSGSFDLQTMPENMKWWLAEYDKQIEAAQSGGKKASARGKGQVVRLKAGEHRTAIAPMLTCLWNQDSPYNDQCPVLDGERCATGCVATAAAQIMYYHKWPERGTGYHSYEWNNQTLSCNFSQSVYDWESMTDTYSSSSSTASKKAVAKLMSDVGRAVDMSYGPSSGTSPVTTLVGLCTYLGYRKGLAFRLRSYYSKAEWDEMIYGELASGRPVFYCGQNESVGHAFVCDGYQDGYYHFNWGWGGVSNGYFVLTALDPESQGIGGSSAGYSILQNVITGMEHDAQTSVPFVLAEQSMDVYPLKVSAASNLRISGKFFSSGAEDMSVAMGLKVTAADGTATYLASTTYCNVAFSYYLDASTYEVKMTSFPKANGTYMVTPAYQDPKTGKWYDIRFSVDTPVKAYTATVANGQITLKAVDTQEADLSFSDVHVAVEPVVKGGSFDMKVHVACRGGEFNGELVGGLVYYEGDDGYFKTPTSMYCNLEAGEETDCTFQMVAPTDGRTYYFSIFQKTSTGSYVMLMDPVPLTIAPAPTGSIYVPDQTVTNDPVYAGQNFTGSLTVYGQRGDYWGPVKILMVNDKYNILGTVYTGSVNVKEGAYDTMTFEIKAPDTPGTYYLVAYNYANKQVSNLLTIDVKKAPVVQEGQLSVTDQRLLTSTVYTGEEMAADVTLKSTGGAYNGEVRAVVVASVDDQLYLCNSIDTTCQVTLKDNETTTLHLKGVAPAWTQYTYYLALIDHEGNFILDLPQMLTFQAVTRGVEATDMKVTSTVEAGKAFTAEMTLTCHGGYDAPVTLLLADTTYQVINEEYYTTPVKMKDGETRTFTIRPTAPADAGLYYWAAFNADGSQVSPVWSLLVQPAQENPEPTPEYVDVTISSALYATYATTRAIVVPDAGLTVYTVKATASGLVLTKVPAGSRIEANQGVLLHGKAGSYKLEVCASGQVLADNDLIAARKAVTTTGKEYALTKKSGVVGFAKQTVGTTIPAGKAYLHIGDSEIAKTDFFRLDSATTGIHALWQSAADEDVYSLQGVKMKPLKKGLYIKDGRKTVIR